jgi:hypothetical protein
VNDADAMALDANAVYWTDLGLDTDNTVSSAAN